MGWNITIRLSVTFVPMLIIIYLYVLYPKSLFKTEEIDTPKPSEASIPKIIHFIWIQPMLKLDTRMPSEVDFNIGKWKEKHPMYEIKIWTGNTTRLHFPDLSELLKQISVCAWIADILRYRILYEYGGFYTDTDIKVIRPIDSLLQKFNTGFTVCERPRNTGLLERKCNLVCNAVIASKRHSPLMKDVYRESIKRTKNVLSNQGKKYDVKLTGPLLLTTHVLRSREIQVLGSFTFFPCDWTDRSKCVFEKFKNNSNMYAMHLWKHSWKGQ